MTRGRVAGGLRFGRAATHDLRLALAELRRIPEQTRHHTPAPPAEGLVLDVGGGDVPHPRADVVVDKYAADNFERGGDLDLTRPVLVGDGHSLPFADGAFAYVIASHVLEHATDPKRFAAELARVATAGFLQVPSRRAELTFGWPFHPWLIDYRDGELAFSPKGTARAPCGDAFHEDFARSALLRSWWGAHRSDWHHSLHWHDRIPVRVLEDGVAEETATFDTERTVHTLRSASARAALQPIPDAVRAALRCPVCHAELSLGDRAISCSSCGREYPLAGEVPVLLPEAAV